MVNISSQSSQPLDLTYCPTMTKQMRILVTDREERVVFDSENYTQILYVYVYDKDGQLMYTSRHGTVGSELKSCGGGRSSQRNSLVKSHIANLVKETQVTDCSDDSNAFSNCRRPKQRYKRSKKKASQCTTRKKAKFSCTDSVNNNFREEVEMRDETCDADEKPVCIGDDTQIAQHVDNLSSETDSAGCKIKMSTNTNTLTTSNKGRRNARDLNFVHCDICGVKYKSQAMLEKHRMVHEAEKTNIENPLQCPICKKVYPNWRSLTIHKRKHGAAKNNICEKCGKGFRTKQELVRHEYVHSNYKSSPCHVCGKLFKNKAYAQMHSKLHSEENRKHKCQLCGKKFLRGPDIQKHMRIHTGEKPFICSQCGRSFSESSHLLRHERLHSGEKPYKCDACDQRFTHKEVLTRHSFTHMEHLPFSCEICNKGFKTKRELDNHWLVHDKPTDSSLKETCTVCGKVFSHVLYLRYHMRTHTNLGNFECPVCSKMFKRHGYLKQHLANQHPYEGYPDHQSHREVELHIREISDIPITVHINDPLDTSEAVSAEYSSEMYKDLSQNINDILSQDASDKIKEEKILFNMDLN